MEVEILDAKSSKSLTKIPDLTSANTIGDIKHIFKNVGRCSEVRQSLRLEPKGKSLGDESTLSSLGVKNGGKLYFKDLGPQIGWTTVFLAEYAGPLLIYLFFYQRPAVVYGAAAYLEPRADVVKYACLCWSGHYLKRLLETMFIHRFSHATMPIRNLFKNCSYYWGFTAFVAYFVNHHLYTPPATSLQVNIGLAGFILCELGNFSIHVLLRNLRPAGSRERKIPYPSSNPLTAMFHFVSCPNYTYEFGAWLSFTVMTQCLPALLFAGAGFYQMAIWAIGKHKNYKKEFKNYPKGRKSILPFIL